MITRSHRQESLSRAYVRTIAAMAGVICTVPEQDYGIDKSFRAVRSRGQRHEDVSGHLDVQIKSTTRADVSETEVAYDLDVRNYEDLRVEGENCPRILVILVLPKDETDWLSQSVDELILRHCAYWMRLEGLPPSKATSTVRVRIPRKNVFSVEALKALLANLRSKS
jgi:hypothetical protein